MSPDGSVRTVVDGRELTISNLDKVFYPETGFTKGQVLDYYLRVAPTMLAHIGDRPLTMKRFPNGVEGPHFFEKHVPVHAPDWLGRVSVPSNTEGGMVEYGVICDVPGLIWAANLATIEFHVPLWHVGRRRVLPAPPDHMVFDLDPGPGSTIVECCIVGRTSPTFWPTASRSACPRRAAPRGCSSTCRCPVDGPGKRYAERRAPWPHSSRAIIPTWSSPTCGRTSVTGKVLIDWSQNHPAKTTVAAYSLRARPTPTVSTPVTWAEVAECAGQGDPDRLRFTADQVVERLESLGDLFAEV